MLRIGVWFNDSHCSFGGPTTVLLGTILGLIQDAEITKRPIKILINTNGDVNWIMERLENHEHKMKFIQNPLIGPICFHHNDAICKSRDDHILVKTGKKYLIASEWFKALIQNGLHLPSLQVWSSGVDTDFFCPSTCEKSQDYFIYFKSQNYMNLQLIHRFLFTNYFKLSGNILTYYYYTPKMLKEEAQKSRFCIFISNTETQGLAPLEIMACDCPMIVLDCTKYIGNGYTFDGATSVTCWDNTCGVKTSLERLEYDFPHFLANLSTYKPREFALKHSFAAAAHRLRDLLNPVETSSETK
jgi:hypothetical protein